MDFKEDFGSSDESLGSDDEDLDCNGQQKQLESDSLLDSSDSSDDDMEVERGNGEEVNEDAVKQELQTINDQIAMNPFSYDLYVEKIKLLKKLGDLEKLRETREKFREMYPLSEQLWIDWLKDEVKLVCTEEEVDYVLKLFDSAVGDYLSVDVWLEYINFCISQMATSEGQERCRDVFERAIGSCGLHVSMGSIIWDMYRDFEAALLGTTMTEEQQSAQESRFISLCRRQLSVPLLGLSSTYEDMKSKIEIDENTEAAYKKALSKLRELESWEAKLVQQPAENKLQVYREYIEEEKKCKSNPARIQVIYERAVTDNPLDSNLWHEYLDYLSKNLKIDKIVLEAANRAARNCSWDITIWLKYMKLVETFKTEDVQESVKSVFERAIIYCSTGEQAGTVWLKYLEFLRRRLSLNQSPEKEVTIFRKTFAAADEHLLQLLVEPSEYVGEILLFRVRFEAQQAKGVTDEVTNLWKEILGRGYGQFAKTWIQYILQETSYGSEVRRIRSHFSKAITQVQDDIQIISNLWINFERDNGDLSSLEQCESKISNRMAKHVPAALSADFTSESHTKTLQSPQKGKKRKVEDKDENKFAGAKKGRNQEDMVDGDSSKAAEPVFKVPSLPNNKPPKVVQPAGPRISHGESIRHDSSKDNLTVFLSNLAFSTGENEIQEFFKAVGNVQEIRLAKDFKGRSKGFGYVLFSKTDEVKAALAKDRQPLGGRPAFVSKCDPDKSTRQKQFKYSTSLEKNKLFVKGLPFSFTADEVRNIFKNYGDLKDCRLATYRNGHSKGFAYVEYLDEVSAAQAILKADGMELGDKKISVALSKPPDRDPSKSSKPGESFTKSSSLDQLQRRAPKAFVPRSLQVNSKKDESNNKGGTAPSTSGGSKSNQDFRNMFLK